MINPGKRRAGAVSVTLLAAIGLAMPASAQAPGPEVRQSRRVFELAGGGASEIGVQVRDVAEADVAKEKLPGASGVVVEDVTADGPAAAAGIKAGDVIVEFDGERVRSTRQLARLVEETPAGRKVQASVMRDGQRVPVSVEPRSSTASAFTYRLPDVLARITPPAPPVAPNPPAPPAPRIRPGSPDVLRPFFFEEFGGRGTARLGIIASELQPQLAEYFGTKSGVLVGSVTANSAAAKAGLHAGDVITTVNGQDVSSPSELRERISDLEDDADVTIGIVREKKPMTLKGKLEAPAPRRGAATL
jgi:serine protease Do